MGRTAALLLVLALSVQGAAACGGWQASAQTRRACCQSGGGCANHDAKPRHDGAAVNQASADSCCASSKAGTSGPSTSPYAATINIAVLVPVVVSLGPQAPARQHVERTLLPRAPDAIPRHLLLSVLLV
jgi:hypothetical protein